MDTTQIWSRVQDIFRAVFDKDELIVTRDTKGGDIDEWDSLSHINLVVAVEQEFNVKFALAEIQELKNVGDMVDLIAQKTSDE